MMPSRNVLPEKKENGRENSRKRLERNRTVRSRPERVARKKMMILKHRSSVIRLVFAGGQKAQTDSCYKR